MPPSFNANAYSLQYMAIEASQFNLFTPHVITHRDLLLNSIEGNGNVLASQFGYGTTPTEVFVPVYGSAIVAGNLPMKSDSVVTNLPISRKRPREGNSYLLSSYPCTFQSQDSSSSFTFLGEDISLEIQQHQSEIDRFIAQHIEKMRSEIDERRKRQCWRIAAAVEENLTKKLKAKDEEMEKMAEINWELEEKVKYLWVENEKWRDLAERNEATANALRCNLEQVASQAEDDAASCCDSSSNSSGWLCRNCAKEESCVLLLPCRHLCVCNACVPSVDSCPICNSTKTAALHVNLS